MSQVAWHVDTGHLDEPCRIAALHPLKHQAGGLRVLASSQNDNGRKQERQESDDSPSHGSIALMTQIILDTSSSDEG